MDIEKRIKELEEELQDLRRQLQQQRMMPNNPIYPNVPITPNTPIYPTNPPIPTPPWMVEKKRCSKCGIELHQVMGYCCPRLDCPCGMGPVVC